MEIQESVALILGHKHSVIERFYERFLATHPVVRPYFAGIDLHQQALMLTMALVVVEANYSGGYPATQNYLRVLGHRHHLAGVKPEHYSMFRDSLMETMGEIHEGCWDEKLRRQWENAIDLAIDFMLEGYLKPYPF